MAQTRAGSEHCPPAAGLSPGDCGQCLGTSARKHDAGGPGLHRGSRHRDRDCQGTVTVTVSVTDCHGLGLRGGRRPPAAGRRAAGGGLARARDPRIGRVQFKSESS